MLENAIDMLILIFPAYVANASPVLLGGGMPMDCGRFFIDKKRILGDGKTWRGFFLGVLSGTVVGLLLSMVLPWFRPEAAFLLSFGALVGDAAGSFIKRRMGTERGKQSILLDQLTFLLFALALSYRALPDFVGIYEFIFLVAVTYVLHLATNSLAHRMGLKKVPW
jgi:CDP-2,3-bis-(O-geranylgeranyl)-sn-glycerol synthase